MMNVLIVDDEQNVRDGIDLSVDWEKYGVTARYHAENGLEALEYLKKFQPAVIFCDMKMPLMNGIELLEKIKEDGYPTQIIVISGYEHIDYTRATIKANGIDYLLKPFRRKDVEEALQKAIEVWKEQSARKPIEAERNYVVQKADALLEEKKLAAYCRGEIPLTASVRNIFAKHGLNEHSLRITLFLPQNRMNILEQRFMMDDELFTFAFTNVAHYTLGGHTPYYLCKLDDYQWLLLTAGSSNGLNEPDHSFYMERLKRAWQQTLHLELLTGRSGMSSDLSGIHKMIGEARNALLSTDLLSGTSKRTGISSIELPTLMNQQFLLMKAIETGNKAFIEDIISKHVNQLINRDVLQLKELQLCTMEANLLLGRWKQLAPEQTGDVQFLQLWINDLQEWQQMFITQIHVLIDCLNYASSSSHSMEQIKDYLDRHFYEEISLTSLAEQFHFSPQYISKKFKDKYNKTIVAYLTDQKIERAKLLLSGTAFPVSDIAKQLGYEDENYFGKVFKKQVGLAPFRYRKENETR